MIASRKIQPKHELKVPYIIFCTSEEAALFASMLMRKNRCNYRIIIVSDRNQITTKCIKKYRAELQISPDIIIPLLMAENNTLYQIKYDNKTKVIKCLDCIIYKIAS